MLDTPARANDRNKEAVPITIPGKGRGFYGGKDNPLLAPRGVHVIDGKLIVADTGQNRVFIWNEIPLEDYQEPDIVLGQSVATNTDRNAGGSVSASSLMYPSGLWSDGNRLVVCDAWNHRVLIWNQWPTENGQAADLVLGQRDFNSNEPNLTGVGATPSAQSLNWPYGVDSDGEKLLIADTGNRRILVYDSFPTTSFAPADRLIGKQDFSERDYDHQQAIWPYSVRIGPEGQIAVADTQYYRVLLYPDLEHALDMDFAPVVIGQETLEGNGQNQFRWFPEAFTLNWCYDAVFYKEGLLVADTGNSRVLHFVDLPTENNKAANGLLGQADFNLGIENRNSIKATPDSMYWPFHLSLDKNLLAIADTGNHRIVLREIVTE